MFQRQHSHSIRASLAPLESLSPVEAGYDRRGPLWLLLAIESYADHLDESAIGPGTLDEIRRGQVALARRVVEPLASLVTWDDLHAAGFWRARALSSLAGEWLAEHAGEPALFDYFRRLPSASNLARGLRGSIRPSASTTSSSPSKPVAPRSRRRTKPPSNQAPRAPRPRRDAAPLAVRGVVRLARPRRGADRPHGRGGRRGAAGERRSGIGTSALARRIRVSRADWTPSPAPARSTRSPATTPSSALPVRAASCPQCPIGNPALPGVARTLPAGQAGSYTRGGLGGSTAQRLSDLLLRGPPCS